MSEIASSGEIVPTTFIRFNPDIWTDENGINHKNDLESRLEILDEELYFWLDEENDEQEHPIEVVHLYYDGELKQNDFIPTDGAEYKLYNESI